MIAKLKAYWASYELLLATNPHKAVAFAFAAGWLVGKFL